MTRNNTNHRTILLSILLAAGLLIGLMRPVRADVTLVFDQTHPGGAGVDIAEKMTLLCKAGNARVELPDGRALLYGKDGIIHTLDLTHKTYYTTFVSDIEAADDPIPTGIPDVPVDEKIALDLKQTKITGTLLGVKARKYLLTGSVTLEHAELPFPEDDQAGGFPGLGARQEGPDRPSGRQGDRGLHLPSGPVIRVEGEVWLSDDIKVSPPGNGLPLAQLLAPTSGPLLKPLADTLAGRKSLVLQARVAVTHTPFPPMDTKPSNVSIPPPASGSPPAPVTSPTPVTTVMTFVALSYSTSPLPDALFHTPVDFNLVGGPPVPFQLGAPVNTYGP